MSNSRILMIIAFAIAILIKLIAPNTPDNLLFALFFISFLAGMISLK